jgi:hypothetical protein
MKRTLAALSFVFATLTAPVFADDACPKLDALIASGQQDISWENLLKPRPNILRNSGFKNAHKVLTPFNSCRITDNVDDVERPNAFLHCSIMENGQEKVTQETRDAFIANEYAEFTELIECISAKDDWRFYAANPTTMTGSLKSEAHTRLEDAIGITFKIEQFGFAPLYRMNLTMELRTVPRDYR